MTRDPNRVRVSGPLAVYAAGFVEELDRWGYSPWQAVRLVQLLAHLSRWLEDGGWDGSALSEERLAEFLRARRSEGYAWVPRLRWMVRLLGCIPELIVTPMVVAETPVETVIADYSDYLVREQGLAAATVRGYVDASRSFLSHLQCGGALDLASLTAGEVRAFVVRECRRRAAGSAQLLVTALRSLLRFLSLKGYTDHPLAGAVPASSAMAGPALPRGVAPEVVAALLGSCDSSTVVGCRDLAIITVLSRLGLRVGEVVRLELDDLDWHHGEIVVRGKGGRQDRLPLPADVGEAIVVYLVKGRPRVVGRAVFLRVHAPIVAMTASNVTEIVRRACRRADVEVVSAHRLRHTAATAMLAGGASLAEIGQVLRQSRAATTAMYAKVDRAALGAVARPWPKVVSS